MRDKGRRTAARRQSGPSRLIRSELGATGVEYGIMLAAIAAVIIVTALALGGKAVEGLNFVNASF